jgi:hypothetical protein
MTGLETLPGTNRPQMSNIGTIAHGKAYAHTNMTIIRARPFVTLPSNGLAMVLQQNRSLITVTITAHYLTGQHISADELHKTLRHNGEEVT